MELKDILSNPVRLRMIQYIQINGTATTKQLSADMNDVPEPTIYRHVNALLKEGEQPIPMHYVFQQVQDCLFHFSELSC